MYMKISVILSLLIFQPHCEGSLLVNVSSNEGAFIQYNSDPNIKEIIFKQPLIDKLRLSVSLGKLETTKELEKSKYKSIVFLDRPHLYMQSNIDSPNFTINAICKFDHENVPAYNFDQVCCQTSITLAAQILSRRVCKLDISHTSSECFLQMEISKKHLDFRYSDRMEITLSSRVFSSLDPNCSSEALSRNYLAEGLPQRIVVSQELPKRWTVTDNSSSIGTLDVGVPVDSLELNSKTVFPIKVRPLKPLRNIDLECTFGSDLTLTTISFERCHFRGELVPLNREHTFKIALHRIEGGSSMSENSSFGELLTNLEIEVQRTGLPKTTNKNMPTTVMSCRVVSARFLDSTLTRSRTSKDGLTTNVEVKVNTEGFVIIPLATERTYYSFFGRIPGPIKLQRDDLKMFFVHNVKDGSIFEVTDKTGCLPASISSLQCPEAQDSRNSQSGLLKPNWNLLLTMGSWQKLLRYPIDLWRAEDWRTVIQDKTLNLVKGWLHFDRTSDSCRPVFQVTRCRLLARIVKDSSPAQKVYFGQRQPGEFPLFDLSGHLNVSDIRMSSGHVKATLLDNSILLSPISVGVSDISILNRLGEKLGFDRITVSEASVSLTDLQVRCVLRLNATQAGNSFNPLFRSITFETQESKSRKDDCHLQIDLRFSDGSSADLADYQSSIKVVFKSSEETAVLTDLSSFVYNPRKYRQPGIFTIDLHKTDLCPGSTLLFSKEVDLFRAPAPSTNPPPVVLRVDLFTTVAHKTPPPAPSTTTLAADPKVVDTDSIFLSMKILIGLVGFVVLVVVLNCVLKLKQRKSVRLIDRQAAHNPMYAPLDKLLSSTYSPLEVVNPQASVQQHPPLLPPPGPLYNASDSSQLDLTVNATPDIFWGLPHSGESMARNSHIGFSMTPLHAQARRTSPSPHSDSLDLVYLTSKVSASPHNGYGKDSDSAATSNCSQPTMNVPPPCAPLRWNSSFCPTQYAMYYPCATDVTTEPSHHSHDNSSQGSLAQSHSSSYEIKQKPVLPPSGFSTSIDNVCEKSSGLGSLSSTKPDSDCSKKDSGCPASPNNGSYFKSQ